MSPKKVTKMGIDLYQSTISPPCVTVRMFAKALDVPLNIKMVDFKKEEHMKPEFLKMNPQHCVPTLVDEGYVLWESRAILIYLNDKFAKDDKYYPKEPAKRADINRLLFFDISILYQACLDHFMKIWLTKTVDPELVKKCHEALALFEKFLEDKKWAAGESLSLADFTLYSTVSFTEGLKVELDKYTNINAWVERCKKELPGRDILDECMEECKKNPLF